VAGKGDGDVLADADLRRSRVGISVLGSWRSTPTRRADDCERRIPDYTYLWWDVRLIPKTPLGRREARFDQQTRVEHTLARGPVSLAPALGEYDDGVPSVEHPQELIDDNKVRAGLRRDRGEGCRFDQGGGSGAKMAAG